jgi:hypothetical protein
MKYQIILNSLNDYLTHTFDYQRSFAHFGLSNNVISAKRKKVDLHLRFFDDPKIREKPTIVIARIGFHKERVGYGKHFMRFISEIAREHKYEFIEFESYNYKSAQFAKSLGFTFLGEDEKIAVLKLRNWRSIFLNNISCL